MKIMKKNILTIVILALGLINVVLTSVMIFTIVPTANKTNSLISQISSVIDLELETPEDKEVQIPVTELEPYKVTNGEGGGSLTINLKQGTDEKDHYAMLDSVTLSVHKKSKDYKKLSGTLATSTNKILEIVTNEITKYSYDDAKNSREEMKANILEKIQNYFQSDFIVDVSFDNLRFQ